MRMTRRRWALFCLIAISIGATGHRTSAETFSNSAGYAEPDIVKYMMRGPSGRYIKRSFRRMPDDTRIKVTLQNELYGQFAYNGQLLMATVDENLVVDGDVVIPAGSRLNGHCAVELSAPQLFGDLRPESSPLRARYVALLFDSLQLPSTSSASSGLSLVARIPLTGSGEAQVKRGAKSFPLYVRPRESSPRPMPQRSHGCAALGSAVGLQGIYGWSPIPSYHHYFCTWSPTESKDLVLHRGDKLALEVNAVELPSSFGQ